MYRDIKSCVSLLSEESAFFSSLSGVRQGENLSLVLFSLYLNDLEIFLLNNSTTGITIDYDTNDFSFFFKRIVLLYTDDTVILANNESDLQFSPDRFNYGVPRGSKAPIRVDPYFKNTDRPVKIRVDP